MFQQEPTGGSGSWQTEDMPKPFLRVTKWLGDIPVEAECRACPGGDTFRVQPSGHRPKRDEYAKQLQRAFEEHLQRVHVQANVKENPQSEDTGT